MKSNKSKIKHRKAEMVETYNTKDIFLRGINRILSNCKNKQTKIATREECCR